jgi:hypothetical protein
VPGEKIPQLQHSREFVEEENPAIVRQTPVIKGDFYVSWRSAHAEPHFTNSDVRLRSVNLDRSPVNKGQNQPSLCILTPDSGVKALLNRVTAVEAKLEVLEGEVNKLKRPQSK